jgi:hypothetical protein
MAWFLAPPSRRSAIEKDCEHSGLVVALLGEGRDVVDVAFGCLARPTSTVTRHGAAGRARWALPVALGQDGAAARCWPRISGRKTLGLCLTQLGLEDARRGPGPRLKVREM